MSYNVYRNKKEWKKLFSVLFVVAQQPEQPAATEPEQPAQANNCH